MTFLTVPMHGTNNTITQSVVKSVCEELMFSTSMDTIKNIIYTQRAGKNQQKQNNAIHQPLRLESDEYIKVEYELSLNKDQMDNDKYIRDYLPIFDRKALGIKLTPMCNKSTIEMQVTFRSKSYDKLVLWLYAFNRANINAAPAQMHSILYNITIPDDIQRYLFTVYELSEKVEGYNDSYLEFLSKGFVEGSGYKTNANGDVSKLVVSVRNNGTLGGFSTLPPDKPTTSLSPPISEITFTYSVNFDHPTAILLEYQKVIHNQLVPMDYLYRYADRRLHDDPMKGKRTISAEVYEATLNLFGVKAYPERLINETDGWQPKCSQSGYKLDSITPIRIDTEALTDVLDMTDLISGMYPDWLVQLMISSSTDVLAVQRWFYFLTLFEVSESDVTVPLEITPEGHLNTLRDMNPRCRYYLCIYKNYRFNTIDLVPYRKNPPVLRLILSMYTDKIHLKTIGGDSYVTNDSLLQMVNVIAKLLIPQIGGDNYFSRTLLQATLSADSGPYTVTGNNYAKIR